MNYEIQTENGYILSLVTYGSEEVFDKEYRNIRDAMKRRPPYIPRGYDYMLRADNLEWELIELPIVLEPCGSYTEELLNAMTNAELQIILSDMGISGNMTKANMVRLILSQQTNSNC